MAHAGLAAEGGERPRLLRQEGVLIVLYTVKP